MVLGRVSMEAAVHSGSKKEADDGHVETPREIGVVIYRKLVLERRFGADRNLWLCRGH